MIRTGLWHPVGDYSQDALGLLRVVGGHVDAEIVEAAHVAVHHELHREGRAFTGVEGHRTDGWSGRSAPRGDFDVRLAGDAERFIAHVGQGEGG